MPVDVLVSDELPAHWPRLDAFEGPGYRRVVVDVTLDASDNADGAPSLLQANVYESWPEGDPGLA